MNQLLKHIKTSTSGEKSVRMSVGTDSPEAFCEFLQSPQQYVQLMYWNRPRLLDFTKRDLSTMCRKITLEVDKTSLNNVETIH
jgi:hypothetical protein